MIPNGKGQEWSNNLATQVKSEGYEAMFEGQRWHYFAIKTLLVLLKGKHLKIPLEQKANLYRINRFVKISVSEDTKIL